MTSLATLILKLNQLTKQSAFYLSRYLGALIHLPHVWRNLHADLHLTALTVTILQLTRQLRMSSLIRIGAPPLLKLTAQTPELKTEEDMQPTQAILPLDLAKLQQPLSVLRERALGSPKPFQAITHTLFQTGSKAQRSLPMQGPPVVKSEGPERTSTPTSLREPSQIYLPLKDEAPAEESLRENVVERWLQQQEETGRRPVMSFVEAHKLYRDMFEEFVATSILPPYLFAERFLETPHSLTFEQARTDLRVRLNAAPSPVHEGSYRESQPEMQEQIPSILLPSNIISTLWAKGSLAFGGPPQSAAPSILRVTPSTSDSSSHPLTPSIFSETIQKDQLATQYAKETNIAPSDRTYLETKEQVPETNPRDFPPETNPADMRPFRSLAAQESPAHDIHPERGLASDEYSEDHRPITSSDHSKQDLRVYSPAAALYSTLAAHARTAFISPTHGNGHTIPSTSPPMVLKPPFAIDRIPQTLIHPDTGHLLSKRREPVTERIERILPVAESHPTPLYLRPPMNLPAVESPLQQRTPATIFPPPNVASTRETIKKSELERKEELSETSDEPEGYPEIEDDAEDAAMREQVKRMGKIIAEEAKRHIGSG